MRDVHGTPDTGLADTEMAHSSGRVFDSTGLSVAGLSSRPSLRSESSEAPSGPPSAHIGGTLTDSGRNPDGRPPARRPDTMERSERYDVVGERARGGLGRILEARDEHLGRTVAIKELLRASTFAESLFVREALITARLQHPGIVPVHEAGRWRSGDPYYVMKLLSGKSLQALIRQKKTLTERMSLLPNVIAVVETIAYAHSQRVIHRDIKPANIMVGKFGETIVVDWGLARDDKQPVPPIGESDESGARAEEMAPEAERAEHTAGLVSSLADTQFATHKSHSSANHDTNKRWQVSGNYSVSGKVVGTPAYMSPEQARGEQVDERTDVYALGALLYEVLTGRPPYPGAKLQDVLDKVLAGPPEPLAESLTRDNEQVKADLSTIVAKAMARDRNERYPTAEELTADLKRFQTGQLVSVHQYSAWTLFRRWLRRHRTEIGIALAAAVLLAIMGALSVHRVIEEKNIATAERAQARAAQQTAEEQSTQLIFLQAEGALKEDPTTAIGWLRRAPLDGLHLERARALYHEAQSLGVARHVLRFPKALMEGHYLPDGQSIVVGGKGGLLRRINRDKANIEVLASVGEMITRVGLSPDGRWVAAGDYAGNVHLLELDASDQSGERPITSWQAHEQLVTHLRFSADGRQLMSVSGTGDVAVRDLVTDDMSAYESLGGVAISDDFRQLAIVIKQPVDPSTATGKDPLGGADAHATTYAVALIDPKTGQEHGRYALSTLATELEMSPDGRYLATYDKSSMKVHLMDLHSSGPDASKFLCQSTIAMWLIKNLHFSPSGRYLAVASGDDSVHLWRLGDRHKHVLRGHSGPIFHMLFSADERSLVTVGDDSTARVWDLASKDVRVLRGHTDDIMRTALSADGGELATFSLDNSMRIWPLAHSEAVRLADHGAPYYQAHLVDDDTLVSLDANGNVDRWQLSTGDKRQIAQIGSVHWGRPYLSPDGTYIYGISEGEHAQLSVWDTDTGRRYEVGSAPKSTMYMPTWTADGAALIVQSKEPQVRIWPVGAQEWYSVNIPEDACGATLAPGGGQIAALYPRAVALLEPTTGAVMARVPMPESLDVESARACNPNAWKHPPRYSPDGRYLAFRYMMDGLLVLDTKTRKYSHYKLADTKITHFEFSRDSTRIAAHQMDRSTHLIDLARQTAVNLGYHEDMVHQYKFAPGDELLASSSYDHTIKVWDLKRGGHRTLRGHSNIIFGISFSPGGERLASGALDSTLRVWDLSEEWMIAPDVLRAQIDASTTAKINRANVPQTDATAL